MDTIKDTFSNNISYIIHQSYSYHGGNPHQLEQQAWIHEGEPRVLFASIVDCMKR